jgi:hypothetical protein
MLGRKRTLRLLALALATMVVAALAGVGTSGATSSASNSDSFNSGSFTAGQWSTSNASAVATGAHDNTYYAEIDDAGSGAYLNWTNSIIEQSHRYWTFRGWFKVVSRNSGQTVGLVDLKNVPGTNNADFFIDSSTGKCVVDLFHDDSAMTSFACDDNAWHLVEMKGDYGSSTYTLDWKIDGSSQSSISSTGQSSTTVKSLWLGDPTVSKTNVQYWDDVRLDVSDSAQSFLGGSTSYG